MTLPSVASEPISVTFSNGFLGVVMLDTQFPRPEGDIGHPSAFGVPTRRCVVSVVAPTCHPTVQR